MKFVSGHLLTGVALAGLSAWGCGADGGDPVEPGAGPGADGPTEIVTDMNTGEMVVANPGVQGQADEAGFVPVTDQEIAEGMESRDPAMMDCGGESYGAEPKQLEMYVLFDDSASWDDNDWDTVKGAVKGFVSDQQSAGIGVALSFFGSQCDKDVFLTPQIGMDTLPNHQAALADLLDSKRTNGETVTQAALAGGIEFARDRINSGFNSRILMLLVTDGEPDTSDCRGTDMGNDIADVAAVAQEGYSGEVSVPTYVLAVAGGETLTAELNTIAVAGGTDQAINADPAELSQVFNEIRNTELAALPCEYALPAAYDSVGDPNLVNLTFAGTPLGRVNSEAECPAEGGWYYDNPAAPTRIVACGTTCENFKVAAEDSVVDIALGCQTVIHQPK